jgi:hypothetical protein
MIWEADSFGFNEPIDLQKRIKEMQKQASIFNNENGSVIFVALIFLALLTLIGVSSINTSSTEVKIASNTQLNRIEFYIAESGWKHGAMWLEGQAGPPSFMNTSGNIVRNFGNGNTDVLNNNFPDGTEDSPNAGSLNDMSSYGIPYWFKVNYLPDETQPVAGSGKNYKRHFYEVESNANRRQEVEAVVSKIFKTGYN